MQTLAQPNVISIICETQCATLPCNHGIRMQRRYGKADLLSLVYHREIRASAILSIDIYIHTRTRTCPCGLDCRLDSIFFFCTSKPTVPQIPPCTLAIYYTIYYKNIVPFLFCPPAVVPLLSLVPFVSICLVVSTGTRLWL